MVDGIILVTGASGGRQGSTGNHVARLLRKKGMRVRALVHRIDQRSDNLREAGAEIVEGDLLDLLSVRKAMEGVRRAFFVYPVQPGLLDATAVFAQAGKETGVELTLNLSQYLTRPGNQPTPHQQRHWVSEQVFDWANVGAVHLNPTVFYENLRALAAGSLARAGAIVLPWGNEETIFPMISAEDVARVAAGVLSGPVMPNGTVLPMIGAAVKMRDMVDAFSALLGKPVQYKEITDEQWVQNVSGAGINPAAMEHLSHLWRHLRGRPKEVQAGYRPTETIEKFSGSKPKAFETFLQENAHFFPKVAAGAGS
jgi:uncharacterized protein YbjT (DUF2867 family)